MNVLVWLTVILFILMIVIGGKKGARSFLSLFINFGVLFITIFLMTNPKNSPILLTLIACTVISWISLFYINQISSKTVTAFISTMITIIILLLFIVWITDIFGGYLSLLIWFKDLSYSIDEIINSKVFSTELMMIFCAGIGIANHSNYCICKCLLFNKKTRKNRKSVINNKYFASLL